MNSKFPNPSSKNPDGEKIICGFHGISAAVTHSPVDIVELFVDERRRDKRSTHLIDSAERSGIIVNRVDRAMLDELAGGVKHQGVIARTRQPLIRGETELFRLLDRLNHPPLLLILDQIQDPQNLGACLRVADGAGVDAVVLPKRGACPVTPAVVRVAAGATQSLPVVYVSNLARTMDSLKERGIWITGTADQSEDTLYDADFRPGTAVAMGAEGTGLRRLTQAHCDRVVRIPMYGSVESLNVSVATGLVLYEAVRQRNKAR